MRTGNSGVKFKKKLLDLESPETAPVPRAAVVGIRHVAPPATNRTEA
jgi:hypothetical protein